MDDRLDTGDRLYQVRVRTRKDDTVASLYDRVIARGLSLVPQLVADARRGRLPREVQPTEGGSYFSAAKESDFRIDWSRDAETLRRWITITPGKCFATVRGERVYLLDAKLAAGRRREKSENRVSNSRSTGILPVAGKNGQDARAAGGPPGTLLRIAPAGCTIAAGQARCDSSGFDCLPERNCR